MEDTRTSCPVIRVGDKTGVTAYDRHRELVTPDYYLNSTKPKK